MNTKYTPGPWRIDQWDEDSPEDFKKFSLIMGKHFDVAYIPNNTGIQEYDARLIACAPELLEALEKLSNWCIENLSYKQFEEIKGLGFEIESLIAKAKGE